MQLNSLALLVTCARVPLSVLQGESISVNSGPSPSNSESRSPFLLVSGGRSLLWLFPVDECLSWFVSAFSNRNLNQKINSTRLLFHTSGSIGPRDSKLYTMENPLHQMIGRGLLPLLKGLLFGSVSRLGTIPTFTTPHLSLIWLDRAPKSYQEES